ncbi:phosphoribosylglycinamide formyltransferase [Bacillus sp. AFS076308]|uniref:phosphoribosylglycinamide formyltransferase n=1 Tax=unclassified Bacillus (in: firmicutes) TaxID=185979 RepID=UPI000BF98719|nr:MULTISPECIES: phosphoribosylglycinamide formyltransferase [unclassified Bacillus (in: firmicutes)]PFN98084.1 phosphoribosylglycinamide formyltransferase [Bacillus sp. AFS076308]PGV50799.1 phosphoribosylglycinamide formyltransferase [Bacillus sp. AFS037270]
MKIAVFASGTGSNFAAILESIQSKKIMNVEVVLLVSDRPKALAVQKARDERIPVFTFNAKDYPNKQVYEEEILNELIKREVAFIVLAGYMRLLGPVLLQAYDQKIINIHPSLLPAFAGKDAIGQALDYGVRVTGVTVHYVDEGMDTGPIIDQRAVTIDPDETRETLTKKIQEQEHRLLPEVIQRLASRHPF